MEPVSSAKVYLPALTKRRERKSKMKPWDTTYHLTKSGLHVPSFHTDTCLGLPGRATLCYGGTRSAPLNPFPSLSPLFRPLLPCPNLRLHLTPLPTWASSVPCLSPSGDLSQFAFVYCYRLLNLLGLCTFTPRPEGERHGTGALLFCSPSPPTSQ